MLVDDHEMVRAGLRALLSQAGTLNIIGEASTAAEAVDLAIELRPDVVLMDLRLPDGSGVDACREILSAAPEVRVLFLTSYADEEAVIATLLAGAAGYVLKDIGYLALIGAIHDAADRRRILDAKLSESVLGRVRSAIQDGKPAPGNPVDVLSPQERRILKLVVEGQTNKEIAAALGLSDKTVKNYLSNAFQKLHVTRRAQAAAVFTKPTAKP
jgi:two-component system response regulator DevR